MKKNLLITAALMVAITLFTNGAKAQDNVARVSIQLADAASIIMNDENKNITFEYNTAADYANEKDSLLEAHFTVISTKTYGISASCTAFSNPAIPLNILNIQVTGSNPGPLAYAMISAATGPTPVINSAPATTSTAFDVEYSIPSAEKLVGLTAGTYYTDITYTFTQL